MQGDNFGAAAVPVVVQEEVKQAHENVKNLEANARRHAEEVK
jgi:hypothetical protein